MKPALKCLIFLGLSWLIYSCSEKEIITSVNSLKATKTDAVQRGEPVIFTFSADSSGRRLTWNVTPAAKAQISSAYNIARIVFTKAGTFTVEATNGIITERTMITVDSTLYDSTSSDTAIIVTPIDTTIHIPVDSAKGDTVTHVKPVSPDSLERITSLDHEELILTPYLVDSLPLPGLAIKATTAGTYKCYQSYLLSSTRESNGKLELLFSGIHEYLNCTSGAYKPGSYSFFSQIKQGSTPLEIEASGTKYTGTVTYDGSSFTIQWPYSSGVRFTTLKVSK